MQKSTELKKVINNAVVQYIEAKYNIIVTCSKDNIIKFFDIRKAVAR